MKRRRWNKFRARFGGYFWMPCPRCGQWYGGHERGGGYLELERTSNGGTGQMTCPDCPGDYKREIDGTISSVPLRFLNWGDARD